MNTHGKTGIWSADENSQDLYQRIRDSQGNLSDENRSSSRYQATSDRVTTGAGGSGITINSGSDSSGNAPGSFFTSKNTEDWEDDDGTSGPGAAATQDSYIEDSQLTGPRVEEVSISERFHEDYGIYEESLGGTRFFYATVGNGEITDSQVTIEFPANMDYVMEKDGVPVDYRSGQTLTERGSYILRISVVEDDSLPFSQQKRYKAVFRFRIQERVASTEQGVEGMGDRDSYGSGTSEFGTGSLFAALSEESDGAMEASAETEGETESGMSSETESGLEESSLGEAETSLSEDSIETILENAIGQGYGAEHLEGYNENTGLVSGYDQETGYYRHQLASGEAFFTDVPNGMTTNYPVRILTSDNLPFRVFKDGEAIEYEPGTAVEEAGSYGVYPHSDSTVYLSSYAGREEPLFQFRILGEAANDLGVINAPEHGRIAGVRYIPTAEKTQEERVGDAASLNEAGESRAFEFCDDWCYVKEDGRYQIDIETETGTSVLEFVKDTRSPYFRYQLDGNNAQILYSGTDVEACRILKDGNLIHSGDPVRQIEGPGEFDFTAYDKAGNQGSAHISIPYKMNSASVLVIILFILLLLVLGVTIKRIKKQVRVV